MSDLKLRPPNGKRADLVWGIQGVGKFFLPRFLQPGWRVLKFFGMSGSNETNPLTKSCLQHCFGDSMRPAWIQG